MFCIDSPPTLTDVSHQWTISTSISYIQWLSLANLELKVALIGRSRSLVAHTSKCEHAMSGHCLRQLLLYMWRICHVFIHLNANIHNHTFLHKKSIFIQMLSSLVFVHFSFDHIVYPIFSSTHVLCNQFHLLLSSITEILVVNRIKFMRVIIQ